MHKRPLLYLPLALASLGLVFALAAWGIRAAQERPLDGRLTVTDPALQTDLHPYRAGNFTISLYSLGEESTNRPAGSRLVVTHAADPGRWLWYTLEGQAFVGAAQGQEQVSETRGSYFFSDRRLRSCAAQSIDTIREEPAATPPSVTLTGRLGCEPDQSIGYTLKFTPVSANQLAFDLSFDPAANLEINRAYLSYASDASERFFGFGEQFSYFDLKGQRVPVWASEQGIGRGRQPVTALVDLAAKSGGNAFTTYSAVPQYITSRLRSLFLENLEYSVFDLRQADRVQIETFAPGLHGRILYGGSPEDLIREYTQWAGRMRPLPDWILHGAVVGVQGGTEKVRQVYGKLQAQGAPVAALWLQDWVGQRATSFGKQLWWNWELDPDRYPDWELLRGDLDRDGVKIMLYTSPFLADLAGLKPNLRRNLFEEARAAGYLVKHPDGTPYLVHNTDFSAGLVDLTNPAARDWYQGVLKVEMVDAGAAGWMADYGEALPYDAVLAGDENGAGFHNAYPAAWAQFNRELIDSLPSADQYVFFNRAVSAQSPRHATLFWEGDQLATWDAQDGIKSAVTGLLSGGLSGLSLNHSDIGGYTGINNPLLKVTRGKELLMRWMEFSAFTTVYRTHEGNLPDLHAQFYSDDETLAHFARFARVYQAWEPLRKRLVIEASQTGVPVARHLFIHYPTDPEVYRLSYQEYLLGSDVLVAPVLDPGRQEVRVYLPAGSWVHAWTGIVYRNPYAGRWITVPAPLGQPGLFVKENTEDGQDLLEGLRSEGLIP